MKGLKLILIQRLALLIGICYLLNPLNHEIKVLIHGVSHALKAPSYIISHDLNSAHEHGSYSYADYHIDDLNHNHVLVDLIDSVLKAFDENNQSEDSFLMKIKIDKHITTCQYQIQKSFEIEIMQKFWPSQEKSKLGYQKCFKEPPQYFQNMSA